MCIPANVETSNFPLSAATGLPDPSKKLPEESGNLFMVKDLGVKGFNGQRLRKSLASCAPEKGFWRKFKGWFHFHWFNDLQCASKLTYRTILTNFKIDNQNEVEYSNKREKK